MNIMYNLITSAEILISLLVSPLPNTDLAIVSQIQSSLTAFVGYLQTANFFFPVTVLGGVLASIFSMELILFTWKLIRWIASIISVGIVK